MGNLLVVRVSSTTFDESDVKKRYPLLFNLAWPENDSHIPASQRFGIIELIITLQEALEYALWKDETKHLLQDFIDEISSLQKIFQKHILSWEPKEANTLSFQIEEKLDLLEAFVKKEKILELQKN